MNHSLFDLETRFAKIDKNTDPLEFQILGRYAMRRKTTG